MRSMGFVTNVVDIQDEGGSTLVGTRIGRIQGRPTRVPLTLSDPRHA
jgi:hypothetical protein